MFNMFENINKKYFSLQIILQFFLRKVLQHVFICPFIHSCLLSRFQVFGSNYIAAKLD